MKMTTMYNMDTEVSAFTQTYVFTICLYECITNTHEHMCAPLPIHIQRPMSVVEKE